MDEMNKEEFENTQESIDTSKEQYQGNMGGPVHKEKKKKNPDKNMLFKAIVVVLLVVSLACNGFLQMEHQMPKFKQLIMM